MKKLTHIGVRKALALALLSAGTAHAAVTVESVHSEGYGLGVTVSANVAATLGSLLPGLGLNLGVGLVLPAGANGSGDGSASYDSGLIKTVGLDLGTTVLGSVGNLLSLTTTTQASTAVLYGQATYDAPAGPVVGLGGVNRTDVTTETTTTLLHSSAKVVGEANTKVLESQASVGFDLGTGAFTHMSSFTTLAAGADAVADILFGGDLPLNLSAALGALLSITAPVNTALLGVSADLQAALNPLINTLDLLGTVSVVLNEEIVDGCAAGDLYCSLETNALRIKVGLDAGSSLLAGLGVATDDFIDIKIGHGFAEAQLAAVPPPPIPEPSTYALMVGGLGLLAVMRRRRKDAQAA